jgi:hypothetical protein
VREALSGALKLFLRPIPNSAFNFEIRRLEFRSESFSVSGTEGVLTHKTLGPEMPVGMHSEVLINGEQIGLDGAGDPGTFEFVRPGTLRFKGVEASGGGYSIIIFTDPVTIFPDLED